MQQETSREQQRADWRVRIATQAQSGLAMTEFCRRAGLCSKTFYRWKARLASTQAVSPNLKLATFLKLEAPLVPPSSALLSIRWHGARIAVFDVAAIPALLAGLR